MLDITFEMDTPFAETGDMATALRARYTDTNCRKIVYRVPAAYNGNGESQSNPLSVAVPIEPVMGVVKHRWDHPEVVRRFLAFLRPCPGCECILFTGTLTNGWGRFVAHDFPECPCGRTQAHRYSYAIFRAPIPSGHQLNHNHKLCNHRNCVNPYHLEPVTPEEHGQISNDYKATLQEHDGNAAEEFFG